MAVYEQDGLTFEERELDGTRIVRCKLHSRYYFDIARDELERLGAVIVRESALDFPELGEKKVYNKIGLLVETGLARSLVNPIDGKRTVYIRDGSGIPLIGSNEFGVVDRGTNILELKPLTGCNFSCIYCSVDEGKNAKLCDYLVEKDYLVRVAAEVAATKAHPVEFNIGPHGEPLLYPELVGLVQDLRNIPDAGVISINTNGSLLSRKLIDDLARAGLTRINLSLSALDERLAAELAGMPAFPLRHILEMLDYGKSKVDFLLAPILVPGKNDQELARIVELSKGITSKFPTIGIQNFLEYPKGRKPVKRALTWEEFEAFIKGLEAATGANLSMQKEDFGIFEEKELPKPLRKEQVIDAIVVMQGRYPNEMYAAAGHGAQERVICVQMQNDESMVGKKVRVRIVRDKHNVYKGVVLGR